MGYTNGVIYIVLVIVASFLSIGFMCMYYTQPKMDVYAASWKMNPVKQQNTHLLEILLWNSFSHDSTKRYMMYPDGDGQKPFIKYKCPILNCSVTRDRAKVNTSDAILFNMRWINRSYTDIPKTHKGNQHWIFRMSENPYHDDLHLTLAPNTFNMTMTYRLNSDIYDPYGVVRRLNNSENKSRLIPQKQNNKETKGNDAPVAWLVSRCTSWSKREVYVKEMRKYIRVDIFGKCGKPCQNKSQCTREHLKQNYKFYLAFENAICKDYITEKFWMPLQSSLVPITLSGGNYSAVAPADSYINVFDFQNIPDLVRHVKILNTDNAKYKKYFEWHQYYRVIRTGDNFAYCKLCSGLLDNRNKETTYSDIDAWWNGSKDDPACLPAPDWQQQQNII